MLTLGLLGWHCGLGGAWEHLGGQGGVGRGPQVWAPAAASSPDPACPTCPCPHLGWDQPCLDVWLPAFN